MLRWVRSQPPTTPPIPAGSNTDPIQKADMIRHAAPATQDSKAAIKITVAAVDMWGGPFT
jgi:hypothetical protein